MKLDRNINGNGRGKYALLKLRKLDDYTEQGAFGEVAKPIAEAIKVLEDAGILDWGNTPETEFMVMRLKDRYSQAGLAAYAREAVIDDPEYGGEIWEMARRAGPASPFCKAPD